MARVKGLMKSKNVGLLLIVVIAISVFGVYSYFSYALDPYLTIRVADIVDNSSLRGVNVTLVNCSNGVILSSNMTVGGIAFVDIQDTWNFSIHLNSSNFVNKIDDNNTHCYMFTNNYSITEEVYPVGVSSFNVSIRDKANGRPIPDAEARVWQNVSPDWVEDQSDNYRCDNGVCTTDEYGNIMLFFLDMGNYVVGGYNINYEDATSDPILAPVEGEGTNVTVEMWGGTPIEGSIIDKYNNEPVEGVNITLWVHRHPQAPNKMLGWDDTYFYNGTTDSNGEFILRLPSDLIGPDDPFDVRAQHFRYATKFYKGTGSSGYYGDPGILPIEGLLNFTGTVYDLYNNQTVENARVDFEIPGSSPYVIYTIYTDSDGEFALKTRNVTYTAGDDIYDITISKDGYHDNTTIDDQNFSADLGNIKIVGNAHITGRVIDCYKKADGTDVPLVSTITFNGSIYETTSDANGDFSINVSSVDDYYVIVNNPGYYEEMVFFTPSYDDQDDNDLCDIMLSGRHRIFGTVLDDEASREPYRQVIGAKVIVHDINTGVKYMVKSKTPDGKYSINISSSNHKYNVTFQYNGFKNKTFDNSGNEYTSSVGSRNLGTTYLVGRTAVTGNVTDLFSPVGSPIFINGAEILFLDHDSSQLLYSTTSAMFGSFSINLGVTGNYDILVKNSGYYNDTNTNSGPGFTAFTPMDFTPSGAGYLTINGTSHVYGIVTDEKSLNPVSGAIVRIYELKDDAPTYWQNVDANGSYDFQLDGDMTYIIESDADGYPFFRADGPIQTGYTGSLNMDMNLTAQFQIFLTDKQNGEGIKNALISLYHLYNETDYGDYTLNETELNVSVVCSSSSNITNVSVTLHKTDGCLPYQEDPPAGLGICTRTQNTTNGSTLFEIVATGEYDIVVDGSSVGCANETYQITVGSDDAGSSLNESYTLEEIMLIVRVVDPIWFANNLNYSGTIDDANVTISVPGPYTNKTPVNEGDGIFTFHFVPYGSQNITANRTGYTTNYKEFNVTNITNTYYINNYSHDPLVLQPLPSNLSVLVLDLSGAGVDNGVNVTVHNTTSIPVNLSLYPQYNTTYTFLTVSGWANFSDLYPGVLWNVSINGTDIGYGIGDIADNKLDLGVVNVVNATIGNNTLFVTVQESDADKIANANVTLWNGSFDGAFAEDGEGNAVSAITDSDGNAYFERLVPRIYNVSITATGFNTINDTVTISLYQNNRTFVINDTVPPRYLHYRMESEQPSQGDVIRFFAHWSDEGNLYDAKLQVNISGVIWEVQKSIWTDIGGSRWSNFTSENVRESFSTHYAGMNLTWRIVGRDAGGNINDSMPWTEFHINDTQRPVITISHTPQVPAAGMEVVYTATATDNYNVEFIKIFVDSDAQGFVDRSTADSYNCTRDGADLTCSYKSTGYSYNSRHYYYAIANDTDGNQGRSPEKENITVLPETLPTEVEWPAYIFNPAVYPSGEAYVFGGKTSENSLPVCEDSVDSIKLGMDPGEITVAAISQLPSGRYGLTAALHPAGGDAGEVYLFGGSDCVTYLNEIWEYDIASKEFTEQTAVVPASLRIGSAALRINDTRIYLFGGDDGNVTYSSDIYYYDVTDDTTLHQVASFPSAEPRSKASVVYDSNSSLVYIIGGNNGSADIDTILEYDPGNETKDPVIVATMPRGRERAVSVYNTAKKRIYILSGYDSLLKTWLDDILEFNPANGNVTSMNLTLADVGEDGRGFAAGFYADHIESYGKTFLMGGTDGMHYFDDIIMYDPEDTGTFRVSVQPGTLYVHAIDTSEPFDPIPDALVEVWGSPNSQYDYRHDDANSTGDVKFELMYPQYTYNLRVNGSDEGWGINTTTIYVSQGFNEIYIALDPTVLRINVTNESGTPVSGATITLYGCSNPQNCPDPIIQGTSNSDGMKDFMNLRPCTNCNVTISKDGSTPPAASQLVTITAGQINYYNIDPEILDDPSLGNATPYYRNVVGENNVMSVNVTFENASGSFPLRYVNVTFLKAGTSDAEGSALTNALGIAQVLVVDGIYDIEVNGEGRGYDSYTIHGIKVGRIVFSEELTVDSGMRVLLVDGQPTNTPLEPSQVPYNGYFAYVRASGYDDFDTGDTLIPFRGTYYDEYRDAGNYDLNNSYRLELYGQSRINGTVTDLFSEYSSGEMVPNALVRVLTNVHSLGGPDDTRYSVYTDENGTFEFNVSPYEEDGMYDDTVSLDYDIKIEKDGYNDYYASGDAGLDGIVLVPSNEYTHDPVLKGESKIKGHVFGINNENVRNIPVASTIAFMSQNTTIPHIPHNITYYSNTSDISTGKFVLDVNRKYGPYILKVTVDQEGYYNTSTGTYTQIEDDLYIYLHRPNRGSVQFLIHDQFGNLLEDIYVSIYDIFKEETIFSQLTDSDGEAKKWYIPSGQYNMTIDGSEVGYGTNTTEIIVIPNSDNLVNFTLNTTAVNITLLNQDGTGIDNLTVNMNSTDYSDIPVNGTVIFTEVEPGLHDITFSGGKSEVYYYNGSPVSELVHTVNITDDDFGLITDANLTFNETRLKITLVDYNSTPVENVTVVIINRTSNVTVANISGNLTNVTYCNNLTYNLTSDSNGVAYFREILPARNYSIEFNESQLHSMGFLMQQENFSIEVHGGNDENSFNNLSIVIGDVYVSFNVTQSNGSGIMGVNISLLNATGHVAEGNDQLLTGLTNSNGLLEIHGVPNTTYTYLIDANETGYGIYNGTINVTLNNDDNSVDVPGLYSMNLTVEFWCQGNKWSPDENINVSVYINQTIDKDATGSDLTMNLSAPDYWVVWFSKLRVYPIDYVINTSSILYFANTETFSYENMNPTTHHKVVQINCPLKRGITVSVRHDGSVLEEGVDIYFVNDTGGYVTGTNGTLIENWTNVTDEANFSYIPDGNFTILVNSTMYFNPDNYSSNSSQLEAGDNAYTFFMPAKRMITVNVMNSTGESLEEAVNISIKNSTGDVVESLNGSNLSVDGITESAIFEYLPDGEYFINISSNMYFSDNTAFNVSAILVGNDTYSFTMTERSIYITLVDSDLTALDHGVNVSLVNSTGGQLNATNGSIIESFIGATDSLVFKYVPDGINHMVRVESNDYFSQNWTFNTSNIAGGNNNHTFTMSARILNVTLNNIIGGLVTEIVTISLTNETGDIVKNTSGQLVNGSTQDGEISFTGLLDGSYNISIVSANYTNKTVAFDPVGGDNSDVEVDMMKKNHGYFNVTVYHVGTSTQLSGLSASLYNGSTSGALLDGPRLTGTGGTTGSVILGVNTSAYDQSAKTLMISVASSSSYYGNNSEFYNVSNQKTESLNLTVVKKTVVTDDPPGGRRNSNRGTVSPVLSTETKIVTGILANVKKSVPFSNYNVLKIDRIDILTIQDVPTSQLTVTASSRPAGVRDPVSSLDGEVYKYLSITATNMPDSIVTKVTYVFRVDKDWVEDNDIDPNEIYMFKYSDGLWTKLTTEMLSSDTNNYYYSSASGGFSIYAIAGYTKRDKDMAVSVAPLSLKGNVCKKVYVSVRNSGGGTLTNLKMETDTNDCCTIKQVSTISQLRAGSTNSISFTICSGTLAEKGSYDYDIRIVSDQLTESDEFTVTVTETYTETLLKQIEALENQIEEIDKNKLNATSLALYNNALEELGKSKETLGNQDFDSAISFLGNARDYFSQIKLTAPQLTAMNAFFEWVVANYIIVIVLTAVIVGLSGLLVKRKMLSKSLPSMPDVPTTDGVVSAFKRSEQEVIDSLMGLADDLERRVDAIDIGSLRDKEIKWHNKVKVEIGNIKRSIEGGNFDNAKRNLSETELFVKMLELNASS